MVIQGLMGFAALACIVAGVAGFEHGFAVGALVAMAFGIRKFLDTHWTLEPKEGRVLRLDEGDRRDLEPERRPKAHRALRMPAPRWYFSQMTAAPVVAVGCRTARR